MLTGLTNLRRLKQGLDASNTEGGESLCQARCCLQSLLSHTMHWGGVFAADTLPEPGPGETVTYIVNSAKEKEEGQHWLALRVSPLKVEFFDSYARPPQDYPNVYPWLLHLHRPIVYLHNCRLQGPNAYCGAYCYFYVTHRPYHRRLYEVFFKHADYRFKYHPPDSLQHLSENDSYVFNLLHNETKRLISILD